MTAVDDDHGSDEIAGHRAWLAERPPASGRWMMNDMPESRCGFPTFSDPTPVRMST
jgi:hypothetical protein